MNSGLKQILKNVFSSVNPEQVAMGMMDNFVESNPKYARYWKQAQEMANSGNAKEKAKNMFGERGVDIETVVDGVMQEIR